MKIGSPFTVALAGVAAGLAPAAVALLWLRASAGRELPEGRWVVALALAVGAAGAVGALAWWRARRETRAAQARLEAQAEAQAREIERINLTVDERVARETAARVEQERMATLGEVSSGLAHELRNPLSAILSGISLLESEKRTEKDRGHIVRLIRREAARLNAALTDFLLYTRPRDPKKVRIELAGLVREIAQMLTEDRELLGETEIEVELAEMPPVWADDDQLRQLIWNVALNALQAMGGRGTLTMRTREADDGRWRIEIEDTGPGIPPEIIGKIFDPFFSTKKQGTGLGLSIAHRIALAHGAEIEAENLEGGGCRVTVTSNDNRD